MSDLLTSIGGLTPGVAAPRAESAAQAPAAGDGFAALLRGQLETVSKMQGEADENVKKLLTGESANMSEVFVAARKAQVAFSLLMEIRNKLVEAYQELQNLRV